MSATFQPIKPEKKKKRYERFAQWKPEGLDREAHLPRRTPLPPLLFFLPLHPPFWSKEISMHAIKSVSLHGMSVPRKPKWDCDHDTTHPLWHVLNNGIEERLRQRTHRLKAWMRYPRRWKLRQFNRLKTQCKMHHYISPYNVWCVSKQLPYCFSYILSF